MHMVQLTVFQQFCPLFAESLLSKLCRVHVGIARQSVLWDSYTNLYASYADGVHIYF